MEEAFSASSFAVLQSFWKRFSLSLKTCYNVEENDRLRGIADAFNF